MEDFFVGLFKFTGELLVVVFIFMLLGTLDPLLMATVFLVFVVALVISSFD